MGNQVRYKVIILIYKIICFINRIDIQGENKNDKYCDMR